MGATRRRFLPPELLVDGLSTRQASELADFFVDVVTVRGFPCHVNVLFNALYFGFDPDRGGYEYAGEFPVEQHLVGVDHDTRGDAVPVGAFVEVRNQGNRLLAGELVGKDGRHRDADGDDVFFELPASLVGAPEDVDGTVREALVVDFATFTDLQIDPATVTLALERRPWLDAYGHVVVDADYRAGYMDELDHYADWLVARDAGRGQLLAWCFDTPPDEPALREAVASALRTIRWIVTGDRRLVSWGPYAMDAAAYRDAIGPASTDRLDLSELNQLFNAVTYPDDRGGIAYRSTGRELKLRSNDWGRDETVATLCGTAWLTAVSLTCRHVADRLHLDAPDGLILRVGTLVHVRVDDRWQSGGLWRVESGDPRPPWADVPPDVALGLGADAAFEDDADGPHEPDGDVDGRPVDEDLLALEGDDRLGWNAYLRPSWHDLETMPLPKAAAARAPSSITLRVVLRHDVTYAWQMTSGWSGSRKYEQVFDRPVVVSEQLCLDGLPWPLGLLPGTRLRCELRGGLLDVSTTRLTMPEQVGDLTFEHVYNQDIARAAAGLPPLERPRAGRSPAATLEEQIARLFSVHPGRPMPGGRLLTWTQLLTGIFGPDARKAGHARRLLMRLEAAIRRMRLATTREGVVWPEDRPEGQTAGSGGSRAARSRLAAIVNRHAVRIHLRELPAGSTASADKRRTYQEARREYGAESILPPDLPDGYTWVDEHDRGW